MADAIARMSFFGFRLFQKAQKSPAGSAVQFLDVQRPIMVRIRGMKTLLNHGEIFILGESSVMVRIGRGQLLRGQSASQLAFVEGAIVVTV